MNRLELHKFLTEYTELEKLIQNFSPFDLLNANLPDFSLERYDFLNLSTLGKDISEISRSMEKLNTFDDSLFIPEDENITFFIHPRFVETPMHKHSFIEMAYVFSGSSTHIINDKRITMQEGDMCILDTNTYHSVGRAGENDIMINFMMRKSYFDTAFISRLSGNDVLSSFFVNAIYQSKDFNDYILFKACKEDNVHGIIENILCEYHDKKTCHAEVINSYMVILFSELLRRYRKVMNREHYEALNNTKISDIILYIQQNFKTATLVSTAERFNFHPIYLSKALKKFSNRTFTDLKNEARLKRACILLENTIVKIDSIADDIGYSNINFFYKIFKDKYGMTPAEYRKTHNGQNR